MISKVFAIRDNKAEAYLQPFMFANQGEAIRAFSDAIQDGKSMFSKHPEDFVLFYIADYDDSKGLYIPKTPIQSLGVAVEYMNKQLEFPLLDNK